MNRMPKRRVAREFGIPYGTLQDKMLGPHRVVFEEDTILTAEEEEEIVSWLKQMSNIGFRWTKQELFTEIKNAGLKRTNNALDEHHPIQKMV